MFFAFTAHYQPLPEIYNVILNISCLHAFTTQETRLRSPASRHDAFVPKPFRRQGMHTYTFGAPQRAFLQT